MSKKRFLSLILSLLIVMPGAVFAKEGNSAKGKPSTDTKVVEQKNTTENKGNSSENKGKPEVKNTNGQEKKQAAADKRDEKKAQIEAFKTAMKAKHEQMSALRQETKVLRQQVEKKTEELTGILNDIEAGKKTLTDDMLQALLKAAGNLKIDNTEVKATSEISTEAKETEARVKGADFNNALASMDKVIAKYQMRLDALKKLDADLDSALAIARMAAAPQASDTTNTTTTTTTTTTDQNSQTTSDGTKTTETTPTTTTTPTTSTNN